MPLKMKPIRTRGGGYLSIDQQPRAAESNVIGNWLEDIPPLLSDVAHQLALHDQSAANDTELQDTRDDDNDKRQTSVEQDDVGSVDFPSIEDPAANAMFMMPSGLPFAKSEADLPLGEFGQWTAQKREEFRRVGNPRVYDHARPESQ